MMNRRHFLSLVVGGVAVQAAVRTWPFRVYSFSNEILMPERKIWIADFSVDDEYSGFGPLPGVSYDRRWVQTQITRLS